ncbi:MAG: PAS domain S-box protein, partial [Desulfobacteraceae bacterium]
MDYDKTVNAQPGGSKATPKAGGLDFGHRPEKLEIETPAMLKLKGDGFIEGPRPISPTPADISLQTLLDALPCPIYYKNRDGAYLECNRAFLDQIIGDDNLKITGKSLVDLKGQVPDKLINLYIEKEMELIKKPGQQRYEAEIRCGDGQTRMFTFHNASIQDADGRVVAIAGLMLDMTTTRMEEAELKRYRDQLEEMATQRSKELTATNNQLSREIDGRRKAEKALENSEARYGSIFENNSTATLLIEPDMTISMANAKAEKMAG